MSTLVISLSESEQNMIENFVQAGEFRSQDDFVNCAIKDALRKAEIARINSLLREGIECKEKTIVTPEFWDEMRRELDEYVKQEGLE